MEPARLARAGERSTHPVVRALVDLMPHDEHFADGGSVTGMFMIRDGQWKYVHYPGYAPELYDLRNDPVEASDLGESAEHAEVRAQCEARLRSVVDPAAATAGAFADQAGCIAALGGRDAILALEDFDHTPVPA